MGGQVDTGEEKSMKLADRVRANIQISLLLDCNGMCHALRHTMEGLTHRGQETGIIYGFLMQLLALRKRFHPWLFVFAWDSQSSLRKQISKEYKANRSSVMASKEEEESRRLAFRQFDLLREEILPVLNLDRWNFRVDGYEADDIIADVVRRCEGTKVIVSQDHDLYQLLSKDCSMYSTKTRREYIRRDFQIEYGIDPERWPAVKAVAGCPGDNVIGVSGVGEQTAIKYLNGMLSRGKKWDLIDASQAQIELNRRLVLLPLDGAMIVPASVIAGWGEDRSELSESGFRSVCRQYGLHSFLEPQQYQQWADAFGWSLF